ncbi:MAG: ComF family protein [Clostridia bacterium]|nr:ComF family protein [Clostridia bacterium]
MASLWYIYRKLFISRKCVICNEPIWFYEDTPLCDECIETWDEHLQEKCHICGKTSANCNCVPKLIRAVSPFACWSVFYMGQTDDEYSADMILLNLKKYPLREVYDFCSERMVKTIKAQCKAHGENYKDYAITYAPRSHINICNYGADQSKELAKCIAKKLDIKLVHALIHKGDKEQKKLNAEQRIKNAESSYFLNEKFECEHEKYFLVDDILTSGATLHYCAKLLLESGAKTVVPVTYCKDNIERGDKNVKRNFKYYFTRFIKGIM